MQHRGLPMVEFTRRQLYDLVWSMPSQDSAGTIPTSEVGLRKACLKYQIPMPPLDYWSKLKAGAAPARVPLPLTSPEDRSIWINRLRGKASPDLLLAREKAISALREQPVPSAQQDERRHSCTRRTRTALL